MKIISATVFVACLTAAITAHADDPPPFAPPYEFVAIYQVGEDEREVRLQQDMILPDVGNVGADDGTLKRIVLRFRRSGHAGAALAAYEKFTVGVRLERGDDTKKLFARSQQVDKIGSTTDLNLLTWADRHFAGRQMVTVKLDVNAKFEPDFLCAQELLYREKQGSDYPTPAAIAKPKNGEKAVPPAATSLEYFKDPKKRPSRMITVDGVELLASFCDKPVSWDKVGSAWNPWSLKPDELEQRHQDLLADVLIKSNAFSRFSAPHAPIKYGSDSPELKGKSVHIADEISFSVLDTGHLFTVTKENAEVGSGETRVFDSGARIAVEVNSKTGEGCPRPSAVGFVYRLKKEGSDPVDVHGEYREKCKVVLDVSLKDYLDHEVRLSVVYPFPAPPTGGNNAPKDLTIWSTTFSVHNLEWFVSIPIYSEIASAVSKGTKDDIAALSSMPISLALGAGTGRLAVSFPARIGYNPASFPNLGRYVNVFAHLSILFSVKSDDNNKNIEFAAGPGINLMEFLYISWGIELQGSHDNLLLVGVDIPDIAGLWKLKLK